MELSYDSKYLKFLLDIAKILPQILIYMSKKY